jgi:phospholipase C
VSRLVKKGFVDHAQYDTTSILRFITKRFALPMLPACGAATRRWRPTAVRPWTT